MEFVLGSPRSPALPASLRYRFRARLEGMIHNLSVLQRGLRLFAKPNSARGGTHLGIVFCISLPPTSLTAIPFFLLTLAIWVNINPFHETGKLEKRSKSG